MLGISLNERELGKGLLRTRLHAVVLLVGTLRGIARRDDGRNVAASHAVAAGSRHSRHVGDWGLESPWERAEGGVLVVGPRGGG